MAEYRSLMDYNIMENALVSLQRIHIRMDKKNKAYKDLNNAIVSIEKVLPLMKPIED